MAAYGLRQDQIASLIVRPTGKSGTLKPIDEKTLRKHFRAELDQGAPKAISKVAEALYKTAIDRTHRQHVGAAIFFLKARAGWSERVLHDGNITLDIDLAGLTEEELAVAEKLLRRKAGINAPAPANAA